MTLKSTSLSLTSSAKKSFKARSVVFLISILPKQKYTIFKVLILLLSFLCFIYLVVNTLKLEQFKNPTSYFSRGSGRGIGGSSSGLLKNVIQLQWDSDTINLYENQLGVSNLTQKFQNKSIKCQNERLLTAFPPLQHSIEQLIWQYVSLLALQANLNELPTRTVKIQAYLSVTARFKLTSLFTNITIPSILTLNPHCYDLSVAEILGDTTKIIMDELVSPKTPFILESSAKRYQDILIMLDDIKKFRPNLQFRFQYFDTSDLELGLAKRSMGYTFDQDKIIIGLYIAEKKLSDRFYKGAIEFHRRTHSEPLFLIICSEEMMTFCMNKFTDIDMKVRQRTNQEDFDLALLSYCNGTIINENFGILPAIINGGPTVVLYKKTHIPYLPYLFADKLTNWYAIS